MFSPESSSHVSSVGNEHSLPSLQPDGQKGAGPRIAPEEKQKCAPSKNKQGAGITVSKEWEAHDWWLQS